MSTDATPFGEWPSPVSPAMVAESGIDFGGLVVDDGAWWLERRPSEEGRGVVVTTEDGEPVEAVPDDVNVRTLVHEYGGGDFAVRDGVVWYTDYEDQRVYRVEDGDPEPITPEPDVERGLRYADLELSPDSNRIYCVREEHFDAADEDPPEPQNCLVSIPADGDGDPRVVASGHDFYSFPRLSPGGDRLAWTTWNHPQMPWDGTDLHVAELDDDGRIEDPRAVIGGDNESVFQPSWGPGGDLYAVSDRTGWWNLYRVPLDGGDPDPVCPIEAEFGVPQWVFDLSTYVFLDDGRIAALVTDEGQRRLGVLAPPEGTDGPADWDGAETWDLAYPEVPYTAYPIATLKSDGESLYFVGSSPDQPPELVCWNLADDPTVLRRTIEVDLAPEYVSDPRPVAFETEGGEVAYGFYYPPTNPDVTAPEGERPPVVVNVHGGPTGATDPSFDLGTQYWTTRGVGVFDVNYRGSTGYGRAYRDRLKGEWGVVDVADCANAAEYLEEEGADPERIAVRGGSAGGFAVLASLAFYDAFDAGTSYFGVSDLTALAEVTHKFESRYLDSLVGPLPEAADRYRERSPLYHADGIDAPLLLLQGAEDPVVPPSQSEEMIEALEENGVPHAYVEFEDEQHGFRKSESIRRAHEVELDFYGQVFGFDPDDDVEGADLTPPIGGE